MSEELNLRTRIAVHCGEGRGILLSREELAEVYRLLKIGRADREYLRAAMMKHFSDKLTMDEIGNFIFDVVPVEGRRRP